VDDVGHEGSQRPVEQQALDLIADDARLVTRRRHDHLPCRLALRVTDDS